MKNILIFNKKKKFLLNKNINIKKLEKKIGINISKNQNFIEYSPLAYKIFKKYF